MINKVSNFLTQNLLIIIFVFCILITCFSIVKTNSNIIILSETGIYQDINIKSIIYTSEKYDMTLYSPITKNRKINREIESVLNVYICKLKHETMYFMPKKDNDKLKLLINFKSEEINTDIVSFIFLVNYSQGKSTINSDIITLTYNLKSGKKLYLKNFFDNNKNYISTLCQKSKEYLITRNDIDEKILNWFIDDINNSLENSFDGYAFSNKYLSIYFNTNKISSKHNDVYEIKIPWDEVKQLLKKNVYIKRVSSL